MNTNDWVRVTIADPQHQSVSVRDLQDAWYRTGGGYHPTHRQTIRTHLAAAELREWFDRADPPPGTYAISVAVLNPVTGATGQIWAHTQLTHAPCLTTESNRSAA